MYNKTHYIALSFVAIIISACSSLNNSNSNWMGDHRQELSPKTLTNLVIPGSHFANAYGISKNKDLTICTGETHPNNLSKVAQIAQLLHEAPDIQESNFIDYLNTQQSNIYDQLDSGIRYLELQICIQNTHYYTSNYYLTDSMDNIIKQIKKFIADHQNEIIIINLDDNLWADYGYISGTDLNNFYHYLETAFGKTLTPKQDLKQLTMEKLWKTPHRVILISANPILTTYNNIWDESQVISSFGTASFNTIKKLTAIQQQITSSEYQEHKFAITPIYSWFNPEINTISQISTTNHDSLIFDYLYSLPPNIPLHIIVGNGNYTTQLVNFAISRNVNNAQLKK